MNELPLSDAAVPVTVSINEALSPSNLHSLSPPPPLPPSPLVSPCSIYPLIVRYRSDHSDTEIPCTVSTTEHGLLLLDFLSKPKDDQEWPRLLSLPAGHGYKEVILSILKEHQDGFNANKPFDFFLRMPRRMMHRKTAVCHFHDSQIGCRVRCVEFKRTVQAGKKTIKHMINECECTTCARALNDPLMLRKVNADYEALICDKTKLICPVFEQTILSVPHFGNLFTRYRVEGITPAHRSNPNRTSSAKAKKQKQQLEETEEEEEETSASSDTEYKDESTDSIVEHRRVELIEQAQSTRMKPCMHVVPKSSDGENTHTSPVVEVAKETPSQFERTVDGFYGHESPSEDMFTIAYKPIHCKETGTENNPSVFAEFTRNKLVIRAQELPAGAEYFLINCQKEFNKSNNGIGYGTFLGKNGRIKLLERDQTQVHISFYETRQLTAAVKLLNEANKHFVLPDEIKSVDLYYLCPVPPESEDHKKILDNVIEKLASCIPKPVIGADEFNLHVVTRTTFMTQNSYTRPCIPLKALFSIAPTASFEG